MSIEKATEFLQEAAKDEKLSQLLKDISPDDFKQAMEEASLDEIAGGRVYDWSDPKGQDS